MLCFLGELGAELKVSISVSSQKAKKLCTQHKYKALQNTVHHGAFSLDNNQTRFLEWPKKFREGDKPGKGSRFLNCRCHAIIELL